ncbi:hypothetical protein AXF12_06015 [Capnocytophaga haemolytica]|uniref:Uncharacterized protein n=1 Tax=Capnocytophaga haemolytica TaxID=45243 RepID=A0ABM5XCU7_9FLAO|nr:hypothetical protein AXF12_06015 [Capnocytophaga haemolytica]
MPRKKAHLFDCLNILIDKLPNEYQTKMRYDLKALELLVEWQTQLHLFYELGKIKIHADKAKELLMSNI